jgi:hypothetical protein
MKPTMTIAEKQAMFAAKTNVVALPVRHVSTAPAETPASANTADASAPVTGKSQLLEIAADVAAEKAAADKNKVGDAIKHVAGVFDCFMDENGSFFLNERGNAVGLESTHGTDIIRAVALKESGGRAITKANLEQVQTALRNLARVNAARPIYRRIGKLVDAAGGTAYLLDLGNKDRRCVHVDAQGVRVVEAESLGVAFSRGKGYAELPEPIMPADAAEAWNAVQPLLQGINKRDHLALVAAKVEHMRCDSPHPILAFLGPEGSGKTSAARRCMMAIDSFVGEAPSVAADGPSIVAAAQVRHSLLIDNVGEHVGGDIENLLCKSSYGAATTVRELFTTSDSRTLALHVCWHLTGITPFLRQADTLDRALVMRVSKPAGYKAESTVRAEFEAQHPSILGGLLYFLAERMRAAPSIEAQQSIKHRMFDLAVTGEAIARALGMAPGEFIKQQESARAAGARDHIEGDRFAAPLVAWLQEVSNGAQPVTALPPKTAWAKVLPWVGALNGRAVVIATPKNICEALQIRKPFDGPEPPRNARATTGAIERVQGVLMKAGWIIERKQFNGGSNSAWAFGAPL